MLNNYIATKIFYTIECSYPENLRIVTFKEWEKYDKVETKQKKYPAIASSTKTIGKKIIIIIIIISDGCKKNWLPKLS